jgi:hypothetical protein
VIQLAKCNRRMSYVTHSTWGKVGRGKYHKRRYNRASRRVAKGNGHPSTLAKVATDIGYAKG